MRKLLSFIIVLVLLTPSAMAQEDLQKGGEPWGEQGDYKGIWYTSRDYMLLNTTYLFLNRHALPKDLATQMTTNY